MPGNAAFDKSLRHAIATSMFLLKNFPKDSIVSGGGGDEHFLPDSTLVDPHTKRQLAFVESISDEANTDLAKLASNYSGLFKRTGTVLPTYAIFPSITRDDDSKVRVFKLSDSSIWEPIDYDSFPTFEGLAALQVAQVTQESELEQQASVDDLKKISEQLGSFLILMFVASVGINIEFSYQQLSILAVACLLLVLPHYKEITIQGLKLVRLHQNETVATKQNPRE